MHPVLFSFGSIRLYSYGVLVAIGVWMAVLLLRTNAKQIFIGSSTVVDLAFVAIVSGFIGARVFYVTQYWDYFRTSPLEVLKIWEGGIILYGGLIGGFVGFSIFVQAKRLPFLMLLDLFVPPLALAQGFGRVGCFLNGCCFGRSTRVPWGVSFPFLAGRVHPTQLYEAVFCFFLAVFLFFLWRRYLKAGAVAFSYFILYPLGRFVIEFVRGDHPKVLLNLTLHQWISLVLVIATSLLFLWACFIHDGKKATDRSA